MAYKEVHRRFTQVKSGKISNKNYLDKIQPTTRVELKHPAYTPTT